MERPQLKVKVIYGTFKVEYVLELDLVKGNFHILSKMLPTELEAELNYEGGKYFIMLCCMAEIPLHVSIENTFSKSALSTI